jgi:hypothetical protein
MVYSLLFHTVSETLKQVTVNPDNLGALCGFFAILHTCTLKKVQLSLNEC